MVDLAFWRSFFAKGCLGPKKKSVDHEGKDTNSTKSYLSSKKPKTPIVEEAQEKHRQN